MTLLSRIPLLLLCLLLLSASGSAQQLTCIAPGSIPVDTVTMVKQVTSTTGGLLLKRTTSHQIIYEVIVMWNPGGEVDLVVDVNTIRITGTASGIDALTSDQVFGSIGSNTVQQALGMGIINCSGLLATRGVRVLQAGCAERIGTGNATHFLPCSNECCVKNYTVQCLLGIPLITLMYSDGPDCSFGNPNSPCRSTCGLGGGIVILPQLGL